MWVTYLWPDGAESHLSYCDIFQFILNKKFKLIPMPPSIYIL